MTINRQDKTKLDFKVTKRTYQFREGLIEIKRMILQDEMVEDIQSASVLLSQYFVVKALGIIGFPKFIDGFYINLITKIKYKGEILGASVYRVKESKLEMVCTDESSCLYSFNIDKSTEIKYLDYFNQFNSN